MAINKVLKVTNSSELLSYIINVTPELASEIDLPVQGESIAPIGKLIMNNERYKNAFINTVNVIGLTAIKRNAWENPWTFTKRGSLRFGQQVREIIIDLCKVNDYNLDFDNKTKFLESEVPNVFNYIHEVNFQKYYKTSISDQQIAMAFDSEDGLLNFVEECVGMLYESLQYDEYLVDKYILCRRIVDGTVTSVKIDNYASLTPRQRVSAMKNISNKMTFRSPKYNPAGVRKATKFEDQIFLMNTEFEGDYSTDVMATSYFRNDAELKSNLALIDSFSETDEARLAELLGDAYVAFTDDEKEALAKVPGVIISREWFMDYDYGMDTARMVEFMNPQTLERNIFLHYWGVKSSSPYENCCVFTSDTPGVSTVTISPAEATVYDGQDLQLSAEVATTGFANKAVSYSIAEDPETVESKKATVDIKGKLHIPDGHMATSPEGTKGVYTIQISTALSTTDAIVIAGVEYTPTADADTAAKQVTAIKALTFANYDVTGSSDTLTFKEKTGHYGVGAPVVDKTAMETGVTVEATTTAGVAISFVKVKATSIYDDTKSDTAEITVL